MPRIAHEAPVELLRQNPLLAVAFLDSTGVEIPAGVQAVMAAGDLSSALPAEFRADAVIALDGQASRAGPGRADMGPELAVLAAFTGAVDLEQDAGRRSVLSAVAAAGLDADRLETYTFLILACASAASRGAMEALMTTEFTKFKDDFVERYKAQGKAEGRAEGEAGMLLRVLAARGFDVPDHVRERVLSCTDLGQLESWGDRAATATSLDEVFVA